MRENSAALVAGRVIAFCLALVPLAVLVWGPRTGDHFIDLLGLGAVFAICMPAAVVLANLSNDSGSRRDRASVATPSARELRRNAFQQRLRDEALECRAAKRPGYETRLAAQLASERAWHQSQSVLARVGALVALQLGVVLGVWLISKSSIVLPPFGIVILAFEAFMFCVLMFCVLAINYEQLSRRLRTSHDRS